MKKKLGKVVVITLATLMVASVGVTIVPAFLAFNQANQITYSDALQVLVASPGVANDAIAKLQTSHQEADYTLATAVEQLGMPAYIAENDTFIVEPTAISKKMTHYTQGKYSQSDTIELAWHSEDGLSVTTYLATENTLSPRIVGLITFDETLQITNDIEHPSVTQTNEYLAADAYFNQSYSQLAQAVGDIYPFAVRYPLLQNSKTANTITSLYTDKTESQRVIKGENGVFLVTTADDTILSISAFLNELTTVPTLAVDAIQQFESDTIARTDFLKAVPTAQLVQISRLETDVVERTYLLQADDGTVFNVRFRDDAFSTLTTAE